MTDSNIVKFKGVLVSYEYGSAPQDKNGKKRYRIGVKVTPEEKHAFIEAVNDAKVYAYASDAFKPRWYKEDSDYINLSSAFPIKSVYWDSDGLPVDSTIDDMYSDLGILTGSNVTVACNLKEGAIYPNAVAFKKLKIVSMADLFANDDDLPFK